MFQSPLDALRLMRLCLPVSIRPEAPATRTARIALIRRGKTARSGVGAGHTRVAPAGSPPVGEHAGSPWRLRPRVRLRAADYWLYLPPASLVTNFAWETEQSCDHFWSVSVGWCSCL